MPNPVGNPADSGRGVGVAPRWTGSLILVIAAFDAAVVQFASAIRGASETVFESWVRGEDVLRPGLQRPEAGRHFPVQGFGGLAITQAFSVGRVADQATVLATAAELFDVGLLKMNVRFDSRGPGV